MYRRRRYGSDCAVQTLCAEWSPRGQQMVGIGVGIGDTPSTDASPHPTSPVAARATSHLDATTQRDACRMDSRAPTSHRSVAPVFYTTTLLFRAAHMISPSAVRFACGLHIPAPPGVSMPKCGMRRASPPYDTRSRSPALSDLAWNVCNIRTALYVCSSPNNADVLAAIHARPATHAPSQRGGLDRALSRGSPVSIHCSLFRRPRVATAVVRARCWVHNVILRGCWGSSPPVRVWLRRRAKQSRATPRCGRPLLSARWLLIGAWIHCVASPHAQKPWTAAPPAGTDTLQMFPVGVM